MDLLLIIVFGLVVSGVMQKHGTWKPLNGIGDFIAWGLVCIMAIALVRIPIYLMFYGWPHGPFNPSLNMQLGSGVVAIAFWWAMTYWRIPGRIYRRLRGIRE
jgi:mannose/fructose/N-acetylgalactosamine-specific phosphotransferase system component IID